MRSSIYSRPHTLVQAPPCSLDVNCASSLSATPLRLVTVSPADSPILQPFPSAQGYQVCFQEVNGKWLARVQDGWGCTQLLPIICAPDQTPAQALKELAGKSADLYKYWVHVLETNHPLWSPKVVYVGALGVRGGGKKTSSNKRRNSNRQGKERNTDRSCTTVPCKGDVRDSTESADDGTAFPVVHDGFYRDKMYLLLDKAETYLNYVETEDSFKPLISGLHLTDAESRDLSEKNEMARKNLRYIADVIFKTLKKLLDDDITTEECLEILLQQRRGVIETRDKNIKSWFTNESRVPIVPTYDPIFELFAPEVEERRAYSTQVKNSATLRFVVLNDLICDVFDLCALERLKPRTINLLRASVQLHPLLAKQSRRQFGHIDECTCFSKIDAVLKKGLRVEYQKRLQGQMLITFYPLSEMIQEV